MFSEDNQKVFNQFWASEYESKHNIDLDSARYDFIRALEALGTISVAQEYYAGFVLTDDSIEAITAILKKSV